MDDITTQLQQIYLLCVQRYTELLIKRNEVDQREKALKKSEDVFVAMQQGFQVRETRVQGLEKTEAYIRETDELRRLNEEEKSRLADEKQKFQMFIFQKEDEFQRKQKSLDDGWRSLREREAKLQ